MIEPIALSADEKAMIRGILAHPDDLHRRVVFCDLLEENTSTRVCPNCEGKAEFGPDYVCPTCNNQRYVTNGKAEWARFIRLQVQLSRWTDRTSCPQCLDKVMLVPASAGPVVALDDNCEVECREGHRWRLGDRDRLEREERAALKDRLYGVTDLETLLVAPVLGQLRIARAVSNQSMERRFAWRFKNGFLDTISCQLDDWYNRCSRSEEDGCWLCGGCGSSGVGPFLVATHPVSRVTFWDREPRVSYHQTCYWFLSDLRQPHALPRHLFQRLKRAPLGGAAAVYETRGDAHDDLSQAALAWARDKSRPV